MKTVTVEFRKEKDTKRTIRFQEVTSGEEEPVIGNVYIKKSALEKIGNPDRVRVTITAG